MQAGTNLKQKERRTLTFGEFKGVDFSSSPLNVRGDRASNMRNFINEYGVNKKRNGWKELLKIKRNGVAQRINGVFEYVHGDRREILVHAGKRFYRVIEGEEGYSYEDITLSSSYPLAKCDPTLFKDERSQAFFQKGRMYLVGCGDYLVYGTWNGGESYELRRVADNQDTYIPTTTVSIDADGVIDDTRSSLDEINCLSKKRINQLLGMAQAPQTWTLDAGEIDPDTDVCIVLETLEREAEGTEAAGEEVAETQPVTYLIQNPLPDKTKLCQVKKNGNDIPAIECGSIDYANGKITLTISTLPQIENRDNLYVTFEHKNEAYIKRITECQFGILFGVDGNTDRLFLSGNPAYPNIDFHSEMDDYTYFSDLSTSVMGSDAVAIQGYGRLSDSTLVIYKAQNGQEASIFYRTGSYRETYDSNGNIEALKGIFPTSAGSIGEGVVSRYACANFSGDHLILSQNGVFGIVLSENVATNERYTRERSRSINERLKKHTDLSQAVAIVYQNRYYLAIEDVCYIADSRYKYRSQDSVDGSYHYEWWFWDHVPVRVWATIGSSLAFGTADGQLCVFDNEYTDRTYQQSLSGDLALDVSHHKVIYNQNIDIGLFEGDRVTFLTSGLYAILADHVTVENGRIRMTAEQIFSFHDGMELCVDFVGNSGLCVDTTYYVKEIDIGQCTFGLEDKEGHTVVPTEGGFSLFLPLSYRELYLTHVTQDSFQVKAYPSGAPLQFSGYRQSLPLFPTASFSHRENVVAEWYTPVMDLGTNAYSKTLLKMTISTEPEVNGKLSFGYETRTVNKLVSAKGIHVFSFDHFSFENFSFDTGFANSYSVRKKERNFNYILFRFVSDNDSNCAVNTFSIVYKINQENRGVK